MQPKTGPKEFSHWIAGFRAKALRNGISGHFFDRALSAVRISSDVIAQDRNQPESSQAIWDYLDKAVSDDRIKNGQIALRKNADLLQRIEETYGVAAEIIVSIWGLESAYGSNRGSFPVIQACATLACGGRRAEMFENELIAALQILMSGPVPPERMLGSWAGAMGHTQFMPTSFRDHAVDFDGDGFCDIWGDVADDALASTAAYLSKVGWKVGTPCAVEVMLPDGFEFSQSGLHISRSVNAWARLGVRGEQGGMASILVPAGASGPAFMVFENFQAILRYNIAIPYALAVSHLADRIAGAGPFKSSWPRDESVMDENERKEFQQRLSSAGFDTKSADGIFGPNTFAALRKFQTDKGLVVDGYPTMRILHQLRN